MDEPKVAVECVMVSYNFTQDPEKAKIVMVSASGLRFFDRWVLTHGSILAPLKEAEIFQRSKGKLILNDEFYAKLPEVYVSGQHSTQEKNVYDNLEVLSKNRHAQNGADLEHSSYLVRTVMGRICHIWQCSVVDRCASDVFYNWSIGHREAGEDEQTSLGHSLLSVFVLIDLEGCDQEFKTLRPLSSLLDIVHPPPVRGSQLLVCSTPFGCEAFLNSETIGYICGEVGIRPSLILTDAATSLGSEGGAVFATGKSLSLIGIVACSVSWCRGEWVGLTLVAPLMTVLSAKLNMDMANLARPRTRDPLMTVLNTIDRTTVLVRCGSTWGSGVYLGDGYFITCSHCLNEYTNRRVEIYCQGIKEHAVVVYRTVQDRPYDLAVLYSSPAKWKHLQVAKLSDNPAWKGEQVMAVGFPYYSEHSVDSLVPTMTNGYVNNVSPSMIQTSCCVQSGFSGGPIIRLTSGIEVVGIIVSNAKNDENAYYPYVNMAVPATAFKDSVQKFMISKDPNSLQNLENQREIIQSQWRLLPYRSKI